MVPLRRLREMNRCGLMSVIFTFVLWIPLQDTGAQESVSTSLSDVEAIADLCDSRLAAIADLDILVEVQVRKAKDHDTYFIESAVYEGNMSTFLGTKSNNNESILKTHTVAPKPTFYRFVRNAAGHVRLEDRGSNKDATDESVGCRECFLGKRWARYVPTHPSGPRVHVDDRSLIPQMLYAVGLELPELPLQGLPRTIGNFIRESKTREWLSGIEEVQGTGAQRLLRLTVNAPHEVAAGDVHLCEHIVLDLDLSRNGVPVRVTSEWYEKKGTAVVPFIMPHGLRGEWSNYVESAPGVWLANQFELTVFDSVARPKAGIGSFQPLLAGGSPVMVNGMQAIDYSKTDILTYDVSTTASTAISISVNRPIASPICSSTFPKGTIVQDDATQEVFQLAGPGNPLDESLRQAFQSGAAPHVGSLGRWPIAVLILTNFVCLLGGVWFFVFRAKGNSK